MRPVLGASGGCPRLWKGLGCWGPRVSLTSRATVSPSLRARAEPCRVVAAPALAPRPPAWVPPSQFCFRDQGGTAPGPQTPVPSWSRTSPGVQGPPRAAGRWARPKQRHWPAR